MFVYFVMHTVKLHEKKCKCFHSQHEHVRVHTKGVYLSKELAKQAAKDLEAMSLRGTKYYVQGYKVRDN